MGKAISFLIWVWMMVSIAGGVYMGQSVPIVTTVLTVAVSSNESDAIYVRSSVGFASPGIIQIDKEQIGYATKSTDYSFNRMSIVGVTLPTQQMVRGANGTTATTHAIGAKVYSPEGAILNQALNYQIATMSDSSGIMVFITLPLELVKLLVTFFALPLGFLGTDLQILTYVWACVSIGILVSLAVALAGGRKAS